MRRFRLRILGISSCVYYIIPTASQLECVKLVSSCSPNRLTNCTVLTVVYIEYLYHTIENTANQNTGKPFTLYIGQNCIQPSHHLHHGCQINNLTNTSDVNNLLDFSNLLFVVQLKQFNNTHSVDGLFVWRCRLVC